VAALARADKELHSMTVQMTPETVRTDSDIQHEVLEELQWDTQVRANEIGIAVTDGIVTLTGWVESYFTRQAAQDAAHRVRGVAAVANEITVRLPSSAERTDAELAQAVLYALKWDAAISTERLEVTVSQGWVTINGDVYSQFQREDAVRVIQRLAGVRGITNLLAVIVCATP
jgi:osmotically-inducible protein OsmY